jgi:hypothetical protein
MKSLYDKANYYGALDVTTEQLIFDRPGRLYKLSGVSKGADCWLQLWTYEGGVARTLRFQTPVEKLGVLRTRFEESWIDGMAFEQSGGLLMRLSTTPNVYTTSAGLKVAITFYYVTNEQLND